MISSSVKQTQDVFWWRHWWEGAHVSEWIDVIADKNGCSQPERVGHVGDGGWWTCTDQLQTKKCGTVYSFGINVDFTYDEGMASKGCDVHGFDPSPAGLSSEKAYSAIPASYHAFGLGGEDLVYAPGTVPFTWPGMDYMRETNTAPWDLRKLGTIMSNLGHTNIDVLKIDVEGSEWFAMPSILKASWTQLLIEVHFPPESFLVQPAPYGARVYQWSQPCEEQVKRFELLRQLLSKGTLWRADINGHCLELSLIRKEPS
jgi:hypothetical protein